jgi:hypothetical protein
MLLNIRFLWILTSEKQLHKLGEFHALNSSSVHRGESPQGARSQASVMARPSVRANDSQEPLYLMELDLNWARLP